MCSLVWFEFVGDVKVNLLFRLRFWFMLDIKYICIGGFGIFYNVLRLKLF